MFRKCFSFCFVVKIPHHGSIQVYHRKLCTLVPSLYYKEYEAKVQLCGALCGGIFILHIPLLPCVPIPATSLNHVCPASASVTQMAGL